MSPALHEGFLAASRRFPNRAAVIEPGDPGATLSYRELDDLTDQVAAALRASGVKPGDRVGVYLPKTVDSVASVLGALKAGAAYVPVDPGSPPARAAFILSDCGVRVVVTSRALAPALEEELARVEARPMVVALEQVGGGRGLREWIASLGSRLVPGAPVIPETDQPAYLLYTSGSTGNPKGVVVSHRAALAFVDWCSDTFRPTEHDRFSSHAPFHFDLSIHDLYVSLRHGAVVVLIDDDLGKDPQPLAELIERERITIWYSTPSILSLLEEFGHLERRDCRSLRYVLFAGEVFPIPRLRRIQARWPWPRYFNLYGPTETNVCTWFEAPVPLPAEQTQPLPIGWPCAHYRALKVDGDTPVAPGERGELLIAGPGIMGGYWNLPERNERAFLVDADGTRWYRTGDLVSEGADGALLFHGRRDRMVKRRGYRIELGEIESGLVKHAGVSAVAVVARPDDGSGVQIHAYLVAAPGQRPSMIELKRHCAEVLPRYMVPDRFSFLDAIPQTSTDKTDYQALLARVG
jgi:amino acid adenylation domain-containing protein